MGYSKPIPSTRLNATRRGLQDFEYLWLLAQTPGGKTLADRYCDSVIYKKPFGGAAMLDTEIWKDDPDERERARIAGVEEISRRPGRWIGGFKK